MSWPRFGAAGVASSSGSGGGGGGDDVTAWGGFTGGTSATKPTTATVNGVMWTIGYGAGDVPLTYTVALTGADDLVVTSSYTSGYPAQTGNINVGGAVDMTLAQAKFLASEVLSVAGAAANGFRARVPVGSSVNSAGASRTVTAILEWQIDHYTYDVWLANMEPAAAHTESGESAVLKTIVFPGWLFGAYGNITTVGAARSEGDDTSRTAAVRPEVNGTQIMAASTAAGVRPSTEAIKTFRALTATSQECNPINQGDGFGTGTGAAVSLSIDTAAADITVGWKINQSTTASTNGLILKRVGIRAWAN